MGTTTMEYELPSNHRLMQYTGNTNRSQLFLLYITIVVQPTRTALFISLTIEHRFTLTN